MILSCDHNFVVPIFGYSALELVGKNISIVIPDIYMNNKCGEKSDDITCGHYYNNKCIMNNEDTSLMLNNIQKHQFNEKEDQEKQKDKKFQNKIEKEENEKIEEDREDKKEEQKITKEPEIKKLKTFHDNELLNNLQNNVKNDEILQCHNFCWRKTGTHYKKAKHRDGSTFPVKLEIFSFKDSQKGLLYSAKVRRIKSDTNKNNESISSISPNHVIGDYIIEEDIGKGTYGYVKLAHPKFNVSHKVAIKVIFIFYYY